MELCKRNENLDYSTEVEVGDIGYTFRKFFPGHGTFDGAVVALRNGIGGTQVRRCIYTDGDDEDIELSHLRTLPKSNLTMNEILDKSFSQTHKSANMSKENSSSKSGCKRNKRNRNFTRQLNTRKRQRSNRKEIFADKKLFSPLGETVPIDEVAEASLLLEKQKQKCSQTEYLSDVHSNNSDVNEEDVWLESVASILANAGKSRQSTARPKKSSGESTLKTPPAIESGKDHVMGKSKKTKLRKNSSSNGSRRVRNEVAKSKEKSRLRALVEISSGSRHGKKVFHVKDPKRVVGEVILEHMHGRIEAIINGEVVTGRSNLFVLAPESKSIGEAVCESVPLPQRLSKYASTHHSLEKDKFTVGTSKKINAIKTEVKDRKAQSIALHITADTGDNETPSGPSSPSESINRENESSVNSRLTKRKSNETPLIALENIFYWSCAKCTMNNPYNRNRCICCGGRKSSSAKLSALLQVADNAIFSATSVEEAMELIPFEEQSTIPSSVLCAIMKLKPYGAIGFPPREMPVETFFKWICFKCTTINFYTKHKCTVCDSFRTFSCKSSKLLDIALKAVHSSQSVDGAMLLIPLLHQMSIPKSVLKSLMTCSEVIGKNNDRRRCLRAKLQGRNFCFLHCNPHATAQIEESMCASSKKSLFDKNISKSSNQSGKLLQSPYDSSSTGSVTEGLSITERSKLEDSHITLLKNLDKFLSSNLSAHRNCRHWNISSIEDSILCLENSPFPQGMLVRRFFPRYGFHDGWISLIQRKLLYEEGKGSRPVLVYRVKYQDGDAEDFMHHEINSLRQIYDVRNVSSIAPPSAQLIANTVYLCHNELSVQILKNITPSRAKNPNEGGRVLVNLSQNGREWAKAELDLTELQLNVIRKVKGNNTQNFINPIIEWPTGAKSQPVADNLEGIESEHGLKTCKPNHLVGRTEWKLNAGLWLGKDKLRVPTSASNEVFAVVDEEDEEDIILVNNESHVRKNLSRKLTWDPAHVCNHLLWDPYRSVICKVCNVDENDHQILICDKCHQGYHMYCLRPIIVNVPTSEWHCPECSSGDSKSQPFEIIMKNYTEAPHLATKFLSLPFEQPRSFFTKHQAEIDLFRCNNNAMKRLSLVGTSRSRSTAKVGLIFFSSNPQKNDWVLPKPLCTLDLYESSLASMVAAMKHCGMNSYSEKLVYAKGVSETMNNASLDNVEPMSRRNIEIFKEFKENLKQGIFPPIKIVFHSQIGFNVEALTDIPRHALIAEYTGEVTTLERSVETDSDSLMILLDTGDPQTSLIIDPTKTGNAARFLNGINNLSLLSKRKANVRTRRFELDGKCRVALFTAKKVKAGSKLYYDYNAGMKGKDEVDWAKNGFYDTRNFF